MPSVRVASHVLVWPNAPNMTDLNSICPANGDVTPYQQHTTVSKIYMSAFILAIACMQCLEPSMADYLSAHREAGSENEPYFVQTLQTLPLDGLSGTVDGSSCMSNSAFTSS